MRLEGGGLLSRYLPATQIAYLAADSLLLYWSREIDNIMYFLVTYANQWSYAAFSMILCYSRAITARDKCLMTLIAGHPAHVEDGTTKDTTNYEISSVENFGYLSRAPIISLTL